VNDRARRSVEKLLGTPLPQSTRAVFYERHQPSGDLSMYTAWARVEMPKEDAPMLVSRLDMSHGGASAETDFLLSSGWNVFPEARPAWFAIREPSDRAVARPFGVNGWLVADYADGALLILATDTGCSP